MTKFLKIKKLVSRHTKGFQAINEHMLLQNCGAAFPDWVTTIFGSSPVVLATIVAILLNVILPKEEKKQGTASK